MAMKVLYIRRETAIYPIVSKLAVFGKVAKGGKNLQKCPIFWANFGRLENRKYKSYKSLIS